MEEKDICILVQELQPLYEDAVLSDACKNVVEKHISACSCCAAIYEEQEQKEENITQIPGTELMEEERDEVLQYQKVAKKIRRKKWLGSAGIVAGMLLLFGLYHVFFRCVQFSGGNSMEPTISDGEYCFISKMAYQWSSPGRGALVYYKVENQQSGSGYFDIGRVVALPGDQISYQEGRLYINGELQEDMGHFTITGENLTVPEEHYYVLGDQIETAYDSRMIGCIAKEQIKGKCIVHFSLPGVNGEKTSAVVEE